MVARGRWGRDLTTVAIVLAPLALLGCFDVQTVDPGPVIIDDFDDGDYLPSIRGFDIWECLAYNPDTTKSFNCAHQGSPGDYHLSLDFTIVDPSDGAQQHGGAMLATFASGAPVDFSHHKTLIFSGQLQSGSPPLSSDAKLYVEFTCGTALGEDGSAVSDFYVLQGVAYSSDWGTFRLSLTNFGPPPWLPRHIAGGTIACLRLVDGIHFNVDASLPDGATGKGLLSIDNIRFE